MFQPLNFRTKIIKCTEGSQYILRPVGTYKTPDILRPVLLKSSREPPAEFPKNRPKMSALIEVPIGHLRPCERKSNWTPNLKIGREARGFWPGPPKNAFCGSLFGPKVILASITPDILKYPCARTLCTPRQAWSGPIRRPTFCRENFPTCMRSWVDHSLRASFFRKSPTKCRSQWRSWPAPSDQKALKGP